MIHFSIHPPHKCRICGEDLLKKDSSNIAKFINSIKIVNAAKTIYEFFYTLCDSAFLKDIMDRYDSSKIEDIEFIARKKKNIWHCFKDKKIEYSFYPQFLRFSDISVLLFSETFKYPEYSCNLNTFYDNQQDRLYTELAITFPKKQHLYFKNINYNLFSSVSGASFKSNIDKLIMLA